MNLDWLKEKLDGLGITDKIKSFTGMESKLQDMVSGYGISSNYFCHLSAGNQVSGEPSLYDMSGMNNHASRGANLSVSQLWANAGYASTVDPVAGSTNSILRLPPLNFDYNGGEKLILWWLGKGTPEGSNASFMGDGSPNGIRLRCQTTGTVDLTTYGTGSVILYGNLSSSVIFDGTNHSFGLVLDGAGRRYAYFADDVLDAEFSSGYKSFSSGSACDTKTTAMFNIGTCFPGSTDGMLVQTRALVVLRLPATKALPTVAQVTALFKQLRANPSLLVSSMVF